MDSVRVAVLGEAGVGKSALTVRSITGRFLHHYDPTLEDEYRCEEKVNGQVVTVAIMDTAGQESNQLEYYFEWADVLLVAFSLDSHSSLKYATHLLQFSSGSRPPSILVATKNDSKGKRVISSEEARSVAEGLNVPYMETSAAANFNVKEAFLQAIEMGLIDKNRHLLTESLFEDSGYLSSMEKKDAKHQKPHVRRFMKGLIQKYKGFRKERK